MLKKVKYSRTLLMFLLMSFLTSNYISPICFAFSIFNSIGVEKLPDSDPWNGMASKSLDGKGTKNDPYLITSAGDLEYIADQIESKNDGGNGYFNKHFRLTHNIDFGFQKRWNPIGTKDNPFKGIIEGQKAVLKNLYIESTEGEDISIFGYVCDAKISDIIISDTIKLVSIGEEVIRYVFTQFHNVARDNALNLTLTCEGKALNTHCYEVLQNRESATCQHFRAEKISNGTVSPNGKDEDFIMDGDRYNAIFETEDGSFRLAKLKMDGSAGGNVGFINSTSGKTYISGVTNNGTMQSMGSGGSKSISNIKDSSHRILSDFILDHDGKQFEIMRASKEQVGGMGGSGGDVGLIVKQDSGELIFSNCINNGNMDSLGGSCEQSNYKRVFGGGAGDLEIVMQKF